MHFRLRTLMIVLAGVALFFAGFRVGRYQRHIAHEMQIAISGDWMESYNKEKRARKALEQESETLKRKLREKGDNVETVPDEKQATPPTP
jgi:hypothetical protein